MEQQKKVIVAGEELGEFMRNYMATLRGHGFTDIEIDQKIGKFYTNRIIKKYSRKDMDEMWEQLYEISQSPGGISFLIDRMDYMPMFEHPRFKSLKSKEKPLKSGK